MDKSIEYAIIKNAIDTIASITLSPPEKVIDLLTGFCWDEEEAGGIKKSKNLIPVFDFLESNDHEPT